MSTTKVYFVCFCIAALSTRISSKCTESYMTMCDNFEDLKNYKGAENMKSLMIGSQYGETKPVRVNLVMDIPYSRFYKLSTLFIVRAISALNWTPAIRCTYAKTPLKHVTIFGNNLTKIEVNHLPILSLKTLSLMDNQIKSLGNGVFFSHEIEVFDISDNLMEVIPSQTLPFTNVTKMISVRNNRLTHIEPDSFPSSLTSLNLDGNQLRFIQEKVFADLVHLKELTLTRNKFTTIPEIKYLKQLHVFDISSNEIDTIQNGAFKNLQKLKLLDLSNNKISSHLVLEWLYTPKKQASLTISLALNRLSYLALENISLQKQTLVLYGNPWNCDTWTELKQKVADHESHCDKEFLSAGSVPYCVNYYAEDPYNNTWDSDTERLRDIAKKSEHNSKCTLDQPRYYWINSINFGCVL